MATTLQALLNIRANVEGEGAVAGLGKAIGGIKRTADTTNKAFGGLVSSLGMGGLAGAMVSLTPLLSASGLGIMAKSAIDAADNMNDLRMKTGVSVEALSQFERAAMMSGTTIDGVAGAMARLSKGMMASKGPAVDALRELGIASTDASGKVRSVDDVMLEVADKFKAMPDGAKKTALALQLFGKSGVDMVPMLNMGSAAIKELGVTMSGEFASKADELNDKLATIQSEFMKIGVTLAESLMPALMGLTNVVAAVAEGFGKLPGPVQTLIASAAVIAIAWGPVVGVITGVVTAITAIGPAIAAIAGVIAGFISWPVLLIAGLVAAGVAIFAFRDQIGAFFGWLAGAAAEAFNATINAMGTYLVKPFFKAWSNMYDAAGVILKGLIDLADKALAGIMKAATDLLFKPFVKSWQDMGNGADKVFKALRGAWETFGKWVQNLFTALGKAFTTFFVDPVRKAFTFVVDAGKNALRGLLSWAAKAINGIINLFNRVIASINRVRSALGQGTFGLISSVTVPAFAEGGFVTQPTMGLVGEAGREYIVPESKAAAFSQNFLAGARGAAAIPSTGGTSAQSANVTVNLTTGPVVGLPDGSRAMPLEDVERLVRKGIGEAVRQLRTPAGRYAMGIS